MSAYQMNWSSPPVASTIWPLVDQAADDLEHFLLLGLDLGEPHGAADSRSRAGSRRRGWTCCGRSFAQLGRGALESQHQGFGLHFLEHGLDALVVDLVEIVEGEHVVHDLLGQVGIGLADVVERRGLDAGAHQVDDFAAVLAPPSEVFFMRLAAGQDLAHHLVEVLERRGLDAVQRGDADQDLVAAGAR